jgi:integrase
LGIAERGERVKTGHNQGVCFDSLALRAEWRALRASLAPGSKVFPFTADQFRHAWGRAKAATGLDWVGPPHDLRHSGAARDILKELRTLEQVRRRGRWKMLSSVQRYTKTWLLVRNRSRLSPLQLKQGAALIARRGPRKLVS